jgi:glucose-1-phosphate cytidylyltransferase
MKVVILAGGMGTRLSEETNIRPKPMVEIGNMPILWHIMKTYSHHGFNDFVLCLGYKGYMIKEYFANYFLHMSDVTIDLRENRTTIHNNFSEPWKITMVDTGDKTMTGGRIKRVEPYLEGERFMVTYGDGVSDIDVKKLLAFHVNHGRKATLTAVKPPGRFGLMEIANGTEIKSFMEKPAGDGGWINGGFFVFEPEVLDYLTGDECILERSPLEGLARDDHLRAFKHEGFWYPMDTLRDKTFLEERWNEGKAPWKVW